MSITLLFVSLHVLLGDWQLFVSELLEPFVQITSFCFLSFRFIHQTGVMEAAEGCEIRRNGFLPAISSPGRQPQSGSRSRRSNEKQSSKFPQMGSRLDTCHCWASNHSGSQLAFGGQLYGWDEGSGLAIPVRRTIVSQPRKPFVIVAPTTEEEV